MAIVPCKECGGVIELPPEGILTGECPYCGAVTTFPKLSNSEMEALYNRAEQYRNGCFFDQAVAEYRKLIEVNPNDPEYYWGLLISRYGIEYVLEGNARIPTCHRMHYKLITSDPDFLEVCKRSDEIRRKIYEKEAERIAEIQKDILAIVEKEKPFDIFICYKHSDESGERTQDSIFAQEIYDALTGKGYHVFFSHITLESKLGVKYEPYIFAALNSAKIMLVVGTRKEYVNAVWVKNEWSRYLALINQDNRAGRKLIACIYGEPKDILPEELSSRQAVKIQNLGWIQDLVHGITKIIPLEKEQPQQVIVQQVVSPESPKGLEDPLLIRAEREMQNLDFRRAAEFCEKALDKNPDNGWAYFLKLLTVHQLQLADYDQLSKILKIVDTKEFSWAKSLAGSSNDKELSEIIAYVENLYSQNLPAMLAQKEQEEKIEKDMRELEKQKALEEQKKKKAAERALERSIEFEWVGTFLLGLLFLGVAALVYKLWGETVWWCKWLVAPALTLLGVYFSQYILSSLALVIFGACFAFGYNVTGLDSTVVRIIIGCVMCSIGIWIFNAFKNDKVGNVFLFLMFAGPGIIVFIANSNWILKGIVSPVAIFLAAMISAGTSDDCI